MLEPLWDPRLSHLVTQISQLSRWQIFLQQGLGTGGACFFILVDAPFSLFGLTWYYYRYLGKKKQSKKTDAPQGVRCYFFWLLRVDRYGYLKTLLQASSCSTTVCSGWLKGWKCLEFWCTDKGFGWHTILTRTSNWLNYGAHHQRSGS